MAARRAYDPDGDSRSAQRAEAAVTAKLDRAAEAERAGRDRAAEAERARVERAAREREEADAAAEREERRAAERSERRAERKLARERARAEWQRERLEQAAARVPDRSAEAEAAERQAERDELERRETEVEAAAARMQRHFEAEQKRAAGREAAETEVRQEAPAVPAARGAGAGAGARPAITTDLWSEAAEKQRDKLDCDTDEAIEHALAMLRSDGIDLHNRRTKLVKNTDGRVFEMRLEGGRSPFRLLYVHHSPQVIEIVRVTPTSAESPAAFQQAVDAALDAAEALS